MPRSRQKSKLNCFKCKIRKSNFFSMCGECSQIYCGNCLNNHECNLAIKDRELKKRQRLKREQNLPKK